jgi:hypothetical protein
MNLQNKGNERMATEMASVEQEWKDVDYLTRRVKIGRCR